MLSRQEVWEEYKVTIFSSFDAQCEKMGKWPTAGYSARKETEKTVQAVDLTTLIDVT